MANLGKKYSCYSCHTKFYDLGKPEPICPKCGADQREAQDTPPVTSRSKRVVDVPADDDFDPDREDDTSSDQSSDDDDSFTEESASDDDDSDEEEEY